MSGYDWQSPDMRMRALMVADGGDDDYDDDDDDDFEDEDIRDISLMELGGDDYSMI